MNTNGARFRQIDGFLVLPERKAAPVPVPEDFATETEWLNASLFQLTMLNVHIVALLARETIILDEKARQEIDSNLKRATELAAQILTRKVMG